MAASTTSLADVLYNDYLGPLQRELGESTFVLKKFKKSPVHWSGGQAIVRLHVGRNTGVGFRGEADGNSGTNLPTAGQQAYDQYVLTSAYLYGRFQISGPAIASAKKGDADALIDGITEEMERLKEDTLFNAGQALYAGGTFLGWLNEHEAKGGASTWEFTGDIDKANTLIGYTLADIDLDVNLIRMDTYALVSAAQVTAVDTAGHLLTLGDAEDTSVAALGAGSTGYAIGVVVNDAGEGNVDVAGDDANFMANATTRQPIGIFGNLGLPTLFTVDRTTATGRTAMQSMCLTHSRTGNHDREALQPGRLHSIKALKKVRARVTPKFDDVIAHPDLIEEYVDVLTAGGAAYSLDPRKRLGGGDAIPFDDNTLTVGGAPITTDPDCPMGCLVFLEMDPWGFYELQEPDFMDLDGKPLRAVANQDALEGYLRWYYQIACRKPNRQGIITGINFTGATAGS